MYLHENKEGFKEIIEMTAEHSNKNPVVIDIARSEVMNLQLK